MRYDNKSFFHETVTLDGNEYRGCTFSHCQLIYHGGPPMNMAECLVLDSTWGFADAAFNAMNFLSNMYRSMGETGARIVEEIFTDVRLGKFIR